MPPTNRNIIIFGATGAVGSTAALHAHAQGVANTTLAMRDPSKPIPALSHLTTPIPKVRADLTDPASVQSAVQNASATVAFIYAVHSADHMRSCILALKAGGVEEVVFLSSFTVLGDRRNTPASAFIPYFHAQIEIVLEEVFGESGFVTVRPAYFASNVLNHKEEIQLGHVKVPNPAAEFDFIAPADIGRVCGGILARRDCREHVVGLVGPERMALGDAFGVVGRVLGREVAVSRIEEEEAREGLCRAGAPRPVAEWMVRDTVHNAGGIFRAAEYKGAVGNVEKYTGVPPTRFQQWVEENKGSFEA